MSTGELRDPETIRRAHTALRRVAAHLVARSEDADDVVQETWLAALRQQKPIRNPEGWLHSVVRYQALRRRRSEALRREREMRVVRALQLYADERERELDPLARRLQRVLDDLREPYRTVVRLRFEDELAPEAIARRLGRPVATVKSQLNRAVKQMRARLPDDERGRSARRSWMLLPLGWKRTPGRTLAWIGAAAAVVGSLVLVPFEREARVHGRSPELAAAAEARASALRAPPSAGRAEARARAHRPVAIPRGTVPELAGFVQDAAGGRVPGARVWAALRGDATSAVQVATADEEGRFRLVNVRPDTYVTAEGDGWLACGWADAEGARAGTGETPLLTLGVRAARNRIAASVRDERGQPIAGARVRQHESGHAPWVDPLYGWRMPGSRPGPETGRDGAFVLDVHHHFAHSLVVTADGYAPALVGVRSEDRGTLTEDIVLARGETLAGRVALPSAAMAAGARVEFRPEAPFPLASARTHADGSFTLPHLARGAGTLTVRGTGASEHLSYRGRLEVPPRAPVHVGLTDAWTVRGTALASDGAPLAGWSVVATHVPARGAVLARLDPWRDVDGRAYTDAEGRFVLAGLELAPHRLHLSAPGEEDVVRATLLVPRPGTGEPVTLVAASELARLEGRVPSAASSAGARTLFLRGPALVRERSVTVGDEGAFAVEGLLPGEYELLLWEPMGLPRPLASPRIEAGVCALGDLALPPEGSLALRIRGPDGPLDPEVVRLRSPEGYGQVQSLPQMTRGRPGEITTSAVPLGRYELLVKARGLADLQVRVDVARPGQPHELVLEPGKLVVVVVHAPEVRAAGSEIEFRLAGPPGFAARRRVFFPAADPDKLTWNLPFGRYRCHARAADGTSATIEFTVSDHTADALEVRLELGDEARSSTAASREALPRGG